VEGASLSDEEGGGGVYLQGRGDWGKVAVEKKEGDALLGPGKKKKKK